MVILSAFFLLLLSGCGGTGIRQNAPSESLIGMAEGRGVSRQDAVHAALQHLIQELLGVFIQSETTVKDARLIEHDVLTYAKGYVERYEIIQEATAPDGTTRLTVLGVVRREALENRLRASGALRVEGERAALNAALSRERRRTLERLAGLLMENAALWHWRVEVETMEHASLPDGRVQIRFGLNISGDRDAWARALHPLLLAAESPRPTDPTGLMRCGLYYTYLEKVERIEGTPTLQVHRWRSQPLDGFPIWLPTEAVRQIGETASRFRMRLQLKDRAGTVVADGLWKLSLPNADWKDDSLLLWREGDLDGKLSVGALVSPLHLPITGTCSVDDLRRIDRIEAKIVASVGAEDLSRHEPLVVKFR